MIVACPDTPSLVAVITACPSVTPETNPLALTVATAGLNEAQVTARLVRGVPPWSVTAAVSGIAPSRRIVPPAGVIVT